MYRKYLCSRDASRTIFPQSFPASELCSTTGNRCSVCINRAFRMRMKRTLGCLRNVAHIPSSFPPRTSGRPLPETLFRTLSWIRSLHTSYTHLSLKKGSKQKTMKNSHHKCIRFRHICGFLDKGLQGQACQGRSCRILSIPGTVVSHVGWRPDSPRRLCISLRHIHQGQRCSRQKKIDRSWQTTPRT